MPINLHISNETSKLDSVILGIGTDPGDPGSNNPKAAFHLENNSYPSRADLLNDVNDLERVLIENGVKIFRPQNLHKKTQLFTRDIGFVIDDELFLSSMDEDRQEELKAVSYLFEFLGPIKTIDLSKQEEIKIEGGDVVLTDDTLFIGLSKRTNDKAFHYFKERFSGKRNVVQVKLKTDEDDHRNNSLHLDCVFNPLGNNHAVIYEEGIKNISELYDHFKIPETNIFKANIFQFTNLIANILSINPKTVIIEKEFVGLKYWLKERGFTVLEVEYKQISKLGGLIRCSTLPLRRSQETEPIKQGTY